MHGGNGVKADVVVFLSNRDRGLFPVSSSSVSQVEHQRLGRLEPN